MIYTHIAAASAWEAQELRLGGQIAALQGQQSTDRARAMADQQSAENAITHKYQGALNEARDRETALRAAAAAARAQSDGLRKQADTAARRLAAVDVAPATIVEYASAANELLADCSRHYQDLAGEADGHTADVRAILSAWPVMSESAP